MSRTSSQAALVALITLSLLGSARYASAQEPIMLEQIGAVRIAAPASTQRPYHLVPVIGAAFTDRRIATNTDEVRSQGGFATAGAARWLAADPDKSNAGRFYLPAVVGEAYSDPRIATNLGEVRRQGGFATAGAVLWLPAAPATVEASVVKAVKVGAL